MPLRAPLAIALVATSLYACADGALPPRTANDPANPNGPESPFTPPPKNASAPSTSTTSSAVPMEGMP